MSRGRGSSVLGKTSALNKQQRIVYTVMKSVGLLMTGLFGLWWFKPGHIPTNFQGWPHFLDYVIFVALSYVVWYQISGEILSWMIASDMAHPRFMKPKRGMRVAFLTAFVPGKEPYDILENTLKHMVDADYPHDTWLLDEGNDKVAKKICKQLGVRHFSRKGIAKYNMEEGMFKAKTKGGNHNAWHDKHGHKYDIVAQLDVDFVPHKDFLTETLGYFRDPKVAFVGIPQLYGNADESMVARGAAEQAYGFYGPTQKGLFGKDMQLFIGANHIVRVAALQDIGGYPGHIVEDHLTGMRLYAKRWKSVYVPEKLAVGEGPATWEAYFGQQMRWAYGLMDIYFKHSPRLLPKMSRKHALNYFFLQQHYFYGLTQVLGVGLITLFFTTGLQATNMELAPLLLLYLPMLIWQLVVTLWLQQFNIEPKTESGLLLRGRLLTIAAWPIYFLAFMGVITGRRLTYAVTPKGSQQYEHISLTLFFPHLILGSVTAIDIMLAFHQTSQAPILLFWAIFNTLFMYGFIIHAIAQRFVRYVKRPSLLTIGRAVYEPFLTVK